MSIIFHNPNQLWYKLTIGNLVSGKSYWKGKYEYLFDFYYNKEEILYIYLDNGKTNKIIERCKQYLLFILWVKINSLSLSKFKIKFDLKRFNSNDILFTNAHLNFSGVNNFNNKAFDKIATSFNKSNVFKIVNMSHYGYNTSILSKNLKNANVDLLFSENDLKNNSSYFKKHFYWYKNDVYQIPFIPQKRFKSIKNFKSRKNLALAVGTITLPIKDNCFQNFFGNGLLQPMRLKILDEKKHYTKTYACHISKMIHKKETVYINYAKYLYVIIKYFYNKNKTMNNLKHDRKYFSTDIVKLFNQYKMFVCPEEIIDLPGIGFVEGMACGSAYIGKRDAMYTDLGMIDKVHYIGYDGTFEDLINKIQYYQNKPKELQVIANNGNKFVRDNFNANDVCSKLTKVISNLKT